MSMTLMTSSVRASVAMPSSAATTFIVVPTVDGDWSRARSIDGTFRYGTTISAPAAKHGKAADPPRGASV